MKDFWFFSEFLYVIVSNITHWYRIRFQFKDCYDDCDGDGCNIGLDVQEQFEDGDQKMCEVCYYRETADGEVLGNKNCQDPDALPETKEKGYDEGICFIILISVLTKIKF